MYQEDFRQVLVENFKDVPKTVITHLGITETFMDLAEGARKGALNFTKLVLDGVWFGYITKDRRVSRARDKFLAYPVGRVRTGDEEFVYIFYTLGFKFPGDARRGILVGEAIDISDAEIFENPTPVFCIDPSERKYYGITFQSLTREELEFVRRSTRKITLGQNLKGITALRIFLTGEILAVDGKDKFAFAVDSKGHLLDHISTRVLLSKLINNSGKADRYKIPAEILRMVESYEDSDAFQYYKDNYPGIVLSPDEIALLVDSANVIHIESIKYRLTGNGIMLILKEQGITEEIPLRKFVAPEGYRLLGSIPGMEQFTDSYYARVRKIKLTTVWRIFARYLLHKAGIDTRDIEQKAQEEIIKTIKNIVVNALKVPSLKHLQSALKDQAEFRIFHTVHKYVENDKAYIPKIELLRHIKDNIEVYPGDYLTFSRILSEITESYRYGNMECFVFELTQEEIQQNERIETREILKDLLNNSVDDILTEIPSEMLSEVRSLGIVFVTKDGKAKIRISEDDASGSIMADILGRLERRAAVCLQCESEEIARKLATVFDPYEPRVLKDMILFGDTDYGYTKYYVRIHDDCLGVKEGD